MVMILILAKNTFHEKQGLLLAAAERSIFYKVGPTCLALLAEFFDTTGATSGGRSTVPICLVLQQFQWLWSLIPLSECRIN